jgi:hypothetical protein
MRHSRAVLLTPPSLSLRRSSFLHARCIDAADYLSNWNPTYYNDVLGVSPKDAKWYLSMPHVTNLLVKVGTAGGDGAPSTCSLLLPT